MRPWLLGSVILLAAFIRPSQQYPDMIGEFSSCEEHPSKADVYPHHWFVLPDPTGTSWTVRLGNQLLDRHLCPGHTHTITVRLQRNIIVTCFAINSTTSIFVPVMLAALLVTVIQSSQGFLETQRRVQPGNVESARWSALLRLPPQPPLPSHLFAANWPSVPFGRRAYRQPCATCLAPVQSHVPGCPLYLIRPARYMFQPDRDKPCRWCTQLATGPLISGAHC